MKARKWLALGLAASLVVGAVSLTGCGQTQGTDTGGNEGGETLTGTINVEGSDTLVNMAQAWAEAFNITNPDVIITVKGGGSGTGIASLINGTVDFADASRQIKDEEVEQAKANGVDPIEHEVAKDGIAAIVNPGNGVSEISLADLGKVYRGEITNWKELGGADTPVVLLGRDTSSGTYEYFLESVVANEDENAKYAPEMRNLQSNQAIVDEVAGNPNAIGYVGVGYISPAVKVLSVDGEQASIDTVVAGTYVLSRGLYMYSNGEPQGVQASYLEWILGPEGQKIVEEQGFVPLAQ